MRRRRGGNRGRRRVTPRRGGTRKSRVRRTLTMPRGGYRL